MKLGSYRPSAAGDSFSLGTTPPKQEKFQVVG